MAYTPALERLEISQPKDGISDAFVLALACPVGPSAATPLVPSLTFLSITATFQCLNNLIVEMLRSRNAATRAGTLRSVRLFANYGSDTIPFVAHLRDEGLDAEGGDAPPSWSRAHDSQSTFGRWNTF